MYAELIEKLKAATGADRNIDAMLHHVALDGIGTGAYADSPRYTDSIDAALDLVEKMLPQASPGVSQNVHHITWHAWMAHVNADGEADTISEATHEYSAPLAILLSLLLALSQEETK